MLETILILQEEYKKLEEKRKQMFSEIYENIENLKKEYEL